MLIEIFQVLKNNNLLIGLNGQLKIADFGLARVCGSPDCWFSLIKYASPRIDGDPCDHAITSASSLRAL